jgi:hypothetical protein
VGGCSLAMVLFGSPVMAALCVLPGGDGCAHGVIAGALIITARKLEIFASLEPVSKSDSLPLDGGGSGRG